MSYSAKEAMERILKGENIRESIQEMDLPVKEEYVDFPELPEEYHDDEDDGELTDEEFDENILGDIELSSEEEELTDDDWDAISDAMLSNIYHHNGELYYLEAFAIRDGKKVVLKKKKKKKLSAKQKAAAKKRGKKMKGKKVKASTLKKRAKSMKMRGGK